MSAEAVADISLFRHQRLAPILRTGWKLCIYGSFVCIDAATINFDPQTAASVGLLFVRICMYEA